MVDKKKQLLKKTDNLVKTTESWWAFGSLLYNSKWLLFFVATTAATMTAALGQIFTYISSFGWAGWFLASIPIFFTCLLLWLLIAWLIHLRPRPTVDTQIKNENLVTNANVDVEKQIDHLREFLFQELGKDRATYNKKLDALSEKVTAVDFRIDTSKDRMAINFGAVAQMHDAQAELMHFEPLTNEIKEIAEHLSNLPLSETWHEEFMEWKKKLNHWVTFPEKYHSKSYNHILSIDTDLLKSEHWTDKVNSIDNSDDALEYKKFRIMYRGFDESHEKATSIIRYKAWNTFSGQGVARNYVDRFKF